MMLTCRAVCNLLPLADLRPAFRDDTLRMLGGLLLSHPVTSAIRADALRVRARFVQKCTLTPADSELVGVDIDLAVQDDVLPLDRTDPGDELGIEPEVGAAAIREISRACQ